MGLCRIPRGCANARLRSHRMCRKSQNMSMPAPRAGSWLNSEQITGSVGSLDRPSFKLVGGQPAVDEGLALAPKPRGNG
jgi:hypothetical protein